MKKTAVIGAILTVLGLAVLTGALIASGFDLSKLGGRRFETKTYPVEEAFRSIDIRVDVSDIAFKPSEDGRCRVVCAEGEKEKHAVSVENGTLKITYSDLREWYEKIGIFTGSPSVTVYLPESTYEALAIDSDTGDFSVPAGFSFESAAVTTDTGDVDIGAIRAGTLTVKVTTGRVRISSAVCEGDVSVTVTTGEVELTDIRCRNLTSRGDTGSVTLKNVVAEECFVIERDTGDVRFEGCDAAEITVTTDTGDVTGTLRTEKVFITKTDTGSVRVPDTTGGGRCQITTDTGDIRITLSGGR